MADKARISAADIAKAILEVTGEALMSSDFASFASVFHVPQRMMTMAGAIQMETLDDMHRAFDEMHYFFKDSGVTELRREVTEAHYVTEGRIASTHVAETHGAAGCINGPYPVFSVIERIDGSWKVTSSEYALEDDSAQAIALSKADKSARTTKP